MPRISKRFGQSWSSWSYFWVFDYFLCNIFYFLFDDSGRETFSDKNMENSNHFDEEGKENLESFFEDSPSDLSFLPKVQNGTFFTNGEYNFENGITSPTSGDVAPYLFPSLTVSCFLCIYFHFLVRIFFLTPVKILTILYFVMLRK